MPRKSEPSPSSSAPERKPRRKRGRGRPAGGGYHPTDDDRRIVEGMAGLGIPEEDMVLLVINPATKRPISPTTLRKHFPEELRTGHVKANVKGGMNLLKLTETSAAAAIFWAKVRLHMKESATVELPGPIAEDEETGDLNDLARRIAFTLVLAGRQTTPKKKAPPVTRRGQD